MNHHTGEVGDELAYRELRRGRRPLNRVARIPRTRRGAGTLLAKCLMSATACADSQGRGSHEQRHAKSKRTACRVHL